MKKKIFISLITVVILIMFLSFSLITFFLYNHFLQYETQQIKNELHLLAPMINKDNENYVKILANSNYRFTLIDNTGLVVYDNKLNSKQMDNHLKREEIDEAVKNGTGDSIRYSSTLTEETIYASLKLDNGMILRISLSQKSVVSLLFDMLPYMLSVIFVAIILTIILAFRISKAITNPLLSINLDNPADNDTYDELNPLLIKIHKQHKKISSQMEELRRKQYEFEKIVSSMKEGLILLNEQGMIISINNAAQKIFDINDTIIACDFLAVDRTPEVNQAVNQALHGNSAEVLISRNGYKYQLNVNPIEYGVQKAGVLMLVFDITDKFFAERNRKEFTANVTHELKTPLQSIIGSVELIETGLAKPQDIGKFIANIHSEADRLSNLINDIIQLSQLDEETNPAMEEVDIGEIITEVLAALSNFAATRNISFEIVGDQFQFNAVRKYIYEIIYNLCDNAVRYNKDGGRVKINTYRNHNNSFIEVSDTGIGIAPEHRSRIFERFYRVDKSHSRETGGTGLGLSIVKHAVQLHNGEIKIDSESGKGTKVTVIFKSSFSDKK